METAKTQDDNSWKKPLGAQDLSIWQKIAKIRQMVKAIQKNKEGNNNSYADEEQVLSKITAGLDTYNLVCYPNIVPSTLCCETREYEKTKTDKKGEVIRTEKAQDILLRGDMVYTFVNVDNPSEKLDVPWSFVGQQTNASFAYGGALTYANRYFFLKFFNAPTTSDDPERYVEKVDDVILNSLIDEIDTTVNRFVTENPARKEEVTELMMKYAKNDEGKPTANYYKITDKRIAEKVLTALNTLTTAAPQQPTKSVRKDEK